MDVSGSGKTTVVALPAGRLHGPFMEGDSLNPPANVAMMEVGHPLTDQDGWWPWLDVGAAP